MTALRPREPSVSFFQGGGEEALPISSRSARRNFRAFAAEAAIGGNLLLLLLLLLLTTYYTTTGTITERVSLVSELQLLDC